MVMTEAASSTSPIKHTYTHLYIHPHIQWVHQNAKDQLFSC